MSNPTQGQHAIGAHKSYLLSTEDVIIRVARELCCPYPLRVTIPNNNGSFLSVLMPMAWREERTAA